MTTKLKQAARQALGALVRAEAMYGQPNADIQTALRETLASRCQTTTTEQAEQEPVAWMDLHKELGKLRWMGGDEGWDNAINAVRDRLIELATPRPVRTKDPCNPWQDLTDDEVFKIIDDFSSEYAEILSPKRFARAVIAADRAKNNLCGSANAEEKNK